MNETSTPEIRWLARSDWAEWDHFASQHPLGSLVHTSAWRAVIEESLPHIRGELCALIDPADGSILAGVPVYLVRSILLGNRLVSIPFATLSDPLFRTDSDFPLFCNALRDASDTRRIGRIEVRYSKSSPPDELSQWHIDAGFKHHTLRLDRAEPDILAATHPRAVRAMIQRGEKAGLTFRFDATETALRTFYRLFLRTRRRIALPPIPLAFFLSLHRHFASSGALTIALVEHSGIPVGAGLILKHRDMTTIEYLGDAAEWRREGVNQCLYWGVIRAAIREGRREFSFGRTANSNQGLLRYKRRWGTEEHDLRALIHTRRKSTANPVQHDSTARRAVRSLCAFAPMPVYRLIGYTCYRHMG